MIEGRDCETCIHLGAEKDMEPCCDCNGFDKWEATDSLEQFGRALSMSHLIDEGIK